MRSHRTYFKYTPILENVDASKVLTFMHVGMMACTTSHIVLDVLYRTGCTVVAVHMLTSMFKKSHIQFFFKCTR